jgi:hypothetical protein
MKAPQSRRVIGMLTKKSIVAKCLTMCVVATVFAVPMSARAQSAKDRYIADRDAAITRFTPERMPKIEQPQMDDEEKARSALEKQMLAIVGPAAPKGFGAAKFNLGSLFTGDVDFGRLDGLVFEADDGRTQMIVTTLPLLQRWLKSKAELSADPDQAMGTTAFLIHAVQTDAAILRYADIPLSTPRTFAMLANRTQDQAPTEANEVFVAAIRGDRVFIANAELKQPIAIAACSSARRMSDQRIEKASDAGAGKGENDEAFSKRMETMRDAAEADFLKCFAERAPKEQRFAAAIARAKELYDRMPVR